MVCNAQSQTPHNHVKIGEGREIQIADRKGKNKIDLDLREEYLKEKN